MEQPPSTENRSGGMEKVPFKHKSSMLSDHESYIDLKSNHTPPFSSTTNIRWALTRYQTLSKLLWDLKRKRQFPLSPSPDFQRPKSHKTLLFTSRKNGAKNSNSTRKREDKSIGSRQNMVRVSQFCSSTRSPGNTDIYSKSSTGRC